MLTDEQADRALVILRGMVFLSHAAREDREDVVQDALLRLVEYEPVLDIGLEFMCGWALNTPAHRSYVLDERRDRNSAEEARRLASLGKLRLTDTREVDAIDAADFVSGALKRLSDTDAIILRESLRGTSQARIGEMIGVSQSTVSNMLNRIRARMRSF